MQFLVILWPPFYNKAEPTLLGIPFFYWFQLLWVIVSAVFTAVVYLATREYAIERAGIRGGASCRR